MKYVRKRLCDSPPGQFGGHCVTEKTFDKEVDKERCPGTTNTCKVVFVMSYIQDLLIRSSV